MDRMKKEKKEKRSILPGVIIVSLLVAAVVYAVLLNAEKRHCLTMKRVGLCNHKAGTQRHFDHGRLYHSKRGR